MLFPAVHQLGFQIGQTVFELYHHVVVTTGKIHHPHTSSNNNNPHHDEYYEDEDRNAATTGVGSVITIILWDLLQETFYFLLSFPRLYQKWWWNLVVQDPLHVAVETTLLISIVYIILSRNTEGYKNNILLMKERLTKMEEEELLWEWKHELRAPLVVVAESSSKNGTTTIQMKDKEVQSRQYVENFQIIVHKQEGKWLTVTTNNPSLMVNKETTTPTTRIGVGNRKREKEVSPTNNNTTTTMTTTTESPSSSSSLLFWKVMNFCNFDFLGMQTSTILQRASTVALQKYGCGSCGPRGFYGTIDLHLQLESTMSQFLHTDAAILYSDGASTCSSTVAAFAKRGDVLVVDEGVYEPLSTGVYLSRANVHWFRHNDMEDLERVLMELQITDKKLSRKPNAQRRFLVVEGLYKNLGTVAPIDKIVELKHKYHYRLILDESFSFGTLGKTGRGVLEAYGKRPMYDAEIITIALENALGSIGGVTVGNEEVVDHQRLSGAGYCFSASTPPFTASAAMAALDWLEKDPNLVSQLQSNVQYMYEQLENKPIKKLVVTSDSRSPIIVLQMEHESEYESVIMNGIMQECLQRGVAIVATGQDSSSSSSSGHNHFMMRTVLAPCIRLTVSTLHTLEDIDKALQTLQEAATLIIGNYAIG